MCQSIITSGRLRKALTGDPLRTRHFVKKVPPKSSAGGDTEVTLNPSTAGGAHFPAERRIAS
jgi:hypothetical protein